MEQIDQKLLESISAHTGISIDHLKKLDIGEIEKLAGIKPVKPQIYTPWEGGGRGYSWLHKKFVSESDLKKRELRVDQELARQGL